MTNETPSEGAGVMADTEDTETLAGTLAAHGMPEIGRSPRLLAARFMPYYEGMARAVLASSWLAARDERIRADEREKPSWPCDDYLAPLTCWTVPSGRRVLICAGCREAFPDGAKVQALYNRPAREVEAR